MKTLAVYNIKGGVGKTASAVNLAYLAAQDGLRTLLWDLDPQSSSTFYLRVRPKIKGGVKKLLGGRIQAESLVKASDFFNLDLLPGAMTYRKMNRLLAEVDKPEKLLRRLLKPVSEEYDLLLLDCPPGISELAETVFAFSDQILVPTIPSTLSIRTLKQLVEYFGRDSNRAAKIRPFFAMVDRRRSLHRQLISGSENEDLRFLRATIPYASVVEQMGTQRAPVFEFADRHPASAAYRSLWKETKGLLFGENEAPGFHS